MLDLEEIFTKKQQLFILLIKGLKKLCILSLIINRSSNFINTNGKSRWATDNTSGKKMWLLQNFTISLVTKEISNKIENKLVN